MVNWFAIIVAAIVSFVLGWIWYSDKVFGKKWRQLFGVSEEMHQQMAADKSRMMKTMSIYVLSLVLMAFVLARIVLYTGAYGVSDGLVAGLWMWLGFSVSASIGSVLWERRPWKYWMLNAGYMLLALLVSGAILASWN